MKPDYYSLAKAGLNQEEIAKISVCEDWGTQIRMLRKCRYKLLEEIHGKQQSNNKFIFSARKRFSVLASMLCLGFSGFVMYLQSIFP